MPRMMPVLLTTTSQVIDALGGVIATAELTKRKYKTAWAWLKRENFPSNTFVKMNEALTQRGYIALHSLWRM